MDILERTKGFIHEPYSVVTMHLLCSCGLDLFLWAYHFEKKWQKIGRHPHSLHIVVYSWHETTTILVNVLRDNKYYYCTTSESMLSVPYLRWHFTPTSRLCVHSIPTKTVLEHSSKFVSDPLHRMFARNTGPLPWPKKVIAVWYIVSPSREHNNERYPWHNLSWQEHNYPYLAPDDQDCGTLLFHH